VFRGKDGAVFQRLDLRKSSTATRQNEAKVGEGRTGGRSESYSLYSLSSTLSHILNTLGIGLIGCRKILPETESLVQS